MSARVGEWKQREQRGRDGERWGLGGGLGGGGEPDAKEKPDLEIGNVPSLEFSVL